MAFLDRLVVMAVKQDSDMSMSESSDSEAISSTPRYLDILHDFLSSVPLSEKVSDNLSKSVPPIHTVSGLFTYVSVWAK
jgi:hypothetical protein